MWSDKTRIKGKKNDTTEVRNINYTFSGISENC